MVYGIKRAVMVSNGVQRKEKMGYCISGQPEWKSEEIQQIMCLTGSYGRAERTQMYRAELAG